MPIVAAISGGPALKLRIGVLGSTDTRQDAHEDKRRVIEAVLAGEDHLFSKREGRELCIGAHTPMIGNDAQDSLRLLEFGTGWCSAVGRWRCSRSLRFRRRGAPRC